MRMHWTHTNAMTPGTERGPPGCELGACLKYESMSASPHSQQSLTQVVGPQVCVCSSCFHMCWTHLTDEREEARSPTGDQFLQPVPKTCSLLPASENNTPQPANFICCHLLSLSFSFCRSLSTWNTTARHPDFPQCTTARLRSRDWL